MLLISTQGVLILDEFFMSQGFLYPEYYGLQVLFQRDVNH